MMQDRTVIDNPNIDVCSLYDWCRKRKLQFVESRMIQFVMSRWHLTEHQWAWNIVRHIWLDRGVIVVSIYYQRGAKFVLLTLWFQSIHETRGILLDIWKIIARLTKQPKLGPDIFSKSVPFVPSCGDASKRCQNTLQIESSNWKDLSVVCLRPHGLVQKGWIYWKHLVQVSVA